jgi:hypothetical protein
VRRACGISRLFPATGHGDRLCRYSRTHRDHRADGEVVDSNRERCRCISGFPSARCLRTWLAECDYNSFFCLGGGLPGLAGRPSIQGRTRDPVTVNRQVQLVGRGRLEFDYQLTLPVLRMLGRMRARCRPLWLYLATGRSILCHHLQSVRTWKRRGYGSYITCACSDGGPLWVRHHGDDLFTHCVAPASVLRA